MSSKEVKDGDSFNMLYDMSDPSKVVKIATMDTGNVLLNVCDLHNRHCMFTLFVDSLNSGGEDTLMAMQITKAGGQGYFAPCARALHLEKPQPAFDEFAARGEMLLRVAELKGYTDESWKREFMPWLALAKESQ